VHVDDGLPELDVDPVLFRRVLDNLLDNAHKYTFDPAPAIALTARHAGDTVELEVADRGAGIAEADLPYVFAPFFRADRSRSRGTGGVGLGLTLAQRIVEAHGATIAVASRLGEGTRVTIRVPAAS
jgi:signal transduction histidine kinase